MSYAYQEVGHVTPFGNLIGWSWVWIGLLVVGKALDVVTTAVGLLYVPGFVEANPFAAVYFDSFGVVTGLLSLSLALIVVVTAVTELGARYLANHEDGPAWGPTVTRFVGYVPLSVVFVFAGLHNAGLIIRVVLLG